MPLPFDHVTLINLYISSYREATLNHANALVVIGILFQIFCDSKNQQILQERQMLFVVVDLLVGSCICT